MNWGSYLFGYLATFNTKKTSAAGCDCLKGRKQAC